MISARRLAYLAFVGRQETFNGGRANRRMVVASTLALLAGVTATALLVTGAFGRTGRSDTFVAAVIPPSLELHRSADAVEEQVLNRLGHGSRIISVRAVPSRGDLTRYLPSLGAEAAPGTINDGPVWIVRASGVFQRVTDPPGDPPLATPREGFVVVDDASGETVAYGWGRSTGG
ncbi:MAG TPA: hypothetical protein VHU90_04540 [Galbitalea sp.]|nr:hypothetical protein [Galbitalea sp.]